MSPSSSIGTTSKTSSSPQSSSSPHPLRKSLSWNKIRMPPRKKNSPAALYTDIADDDKDFINDGDDDVPS